jgi:tyrosine-protein kinase Etk/Wzc
MVDQLFVILNSVDIKRRGYGYGYGYGYGEYYTDEKAPKKGLFKRR